MKAAAKASMSAVAVAVSVGEISVFHAQPVALPMVGSASGVGDDHLEEDFTRCSTGCRAT